MGRIWWLLLNAFAVGVINAAPREYSIDELITKPRPGEEYVNIQTNSKGKVDLKEQAFTTSHRIPELSKTNRTQDFQTSHKIPQNVQRPSRSLSLESDSGYEEPSFGTETRVSYSIVEGTTIEPPLERVVTKTSIKMSKSKKVQKSVLKGGQDDHVDIKADDGVIDEKDSADEEEQKIMEKKFLNNEGVETADSKVAFFPLRLNVPLEDDVKDVTYNKHLLIPNPVLVTTQDPPITTFNYKNIYEKMKKGQGVITLIPENEKEKNRYEMVSVSESIKTAESKAIALKKDTKQEKKDKHKKDDVNQKENSGFFVLPVNKQNSKSKEENYDFVDVDEKVLVPAGSSSSQSSRINIKKGPNGQDYEYEYVYYYYDDDEEDGGVNGGTALKEGKTLSGTTEKVYNGHDGPGKDEREQNFVQATSTSGNKYLPTEAPKTLSKGNKKSRTEEVEVSRKDLPVQNGGSTKTSRGGNGNRYSSTSSKQQEVNEVLPSSGRSGFRARGRSSSTTTEEIPAIGEERLPPNTRFPPRARSNSGSATASPQSQEGTTENKRNRNREGTSQSRLRIPNSSLLDSSSFRTHASDASIDEDSGYDTELHRKANARGESSSRRGSRPTAAAPVDGGETSEVIRRPTVKKPTEDKRIKVSVQEDDEEEVQERHPKVPVEESPRVPITAYDESEPVKPTVHHEEARGVASVDGQAQIPTEGSFSEQGITTGQLAIGQQIVGQVNNGQQVVGGQAINDEQIVRGQQDFTSQQVITSQQTIGGQQIYTGQQPTDIKSGEHQQRPDVAGVHTIGEGSLIQTPYTQGGEYQGSIDQSQGVKYKSVESTTEDQSVIGLTSAMMEKVALDLYAILQQAQNENIRTNFVDGNSTDITTDGLNDGSTEYPIYDDGSTAELSNPVTTTTTTTTTTTPAPTTTTTTTTTPAPTQATGRGRYRGRAPVGKGRSKASSTTTTEAPEEITSPKTRGRYHTNHGGRGTGPSYVRKQSTKAAAKESVQDASVSEETPKAAPEKSFGGRSRFRASGKVTANPSTTASPPASSASAVTRGLSSDRFNSRRRGGVRGAFPPQQPAAEEAIDEAKHESSQDTSPDEGASPAPAPKSVRPRIGSGVRPLRPGPRAPLLLPRGHANAASSTTQLPVEHGEAEKEANEPEGQVQQQNDENQEAATPQPGDALTRLRSRPRLRIGANANQRPQSPPPPPANRRKLVSSLLPKKKPNEEKPAEKVEEEEKIQEEVPIDEEQSIVQEEVITTTEAEAKGLSGLLAGRRRNLNRRPGTLYSRGQAS